MLAESKRQFAAIMLMVKPLGTILTNGISVPEFELKNGNLTRFYFPSVRIRGFDLTNRTNKKGHNTIYVIIADL